MFRLKMIATSASTPTAAVAAYRLGGDEKLIDAVKANFQSAPISDKLKALLAIAGSVQKGGSKSPANRSSWARSQGATDKEIHDNSADCSRVLHVQRYVDGLATWAPTDSRMYRENEKRLADHGYLVSTAKLVGA